MFHMLDMRPGQPKYMEQLARAFEALRKALTSLQHDYETSQLAVRQPTFIPYPLQDVRLVSCSNSAAGTSMYPTALRMQHLLAWHSATYFGMLHTWAECWLPSYHTQVLLMHLGTCVPSLVGMHCQSEKREGKVPSL